MRRICCFCECWESGGIESFLTNVLAHLDLETMEVDIVAADLRESVFTDCLLSLGVHFYELSGNQRNLLGNWRLFFQLLLERDYDVVYVNAFHGLSLCYMLLAKMAGVPVRIAHSHNTNLRSSRSKWIKMVIHNLSKKLFLCAATELWACSIPAAEFLFTKNCMAKRPFQIMLNGIDICRFRFDQEKRDKTRAELGIKDEFVIGNVGRLCYQKNQIFLLRVMAEVLPRRPGCKLLLVGEGKDGVMLKTMARQLKIEDSVIFYGVSNEIEKLFCAMDVFAFPSRFEGLGIVAVEAQTCGLPVLCSTNVPREARPTESVLELELEVPVWVQYLSTMKAKRDKELFRQVKCAGYDITDVAVRIQRAFCGEERI